MKLSNLRWEGLGKFVAPLMLIVAVVWAWRAFHPSPIERMVNRCQETMIGGTCQVALDGGDYRNPTILLGSFGYVSTDSYLKLRNAGLTRRPNSEFEMCALVREVCVHWHSDECKVARALWATNS